MSNIRCKKCGKNAAIRMRQHRLSLCKEHYIEWVLEQTARTIDRYHMFGINDRILVAVSGGKDSLALWDVLWQLGYQADGVYIDLGINKGHAYSENSKNFSLEFARERNLKLHIIDIKALYGKSMIEISIQNRRGIGKPCSVCGLVKRHEMNRITQQQGYNVIATGHNLDDEAAILFGNTFNWQTDLLLRQAPLLEDAPGLAKKAKPFCRFYERETAAYSILRNIKYIYEECPYSKGSTSLEYKQILNNIEEQQPGAKIRFYARFLKARKAGLFGDQPDLLNSEELHPCDNCGQLTSAPKICSFCRLFE